MHFTTILYRSDFSDAALDKGGRKCRGYRSGHYVREVVGPEYEGEENREQKLRRLRYELEELVSAAGDGADSAKVSFFQ